jgi:hypothetical protein
MILKQILECEDVRVKYVHYIQDGVNWQTIVNIPYKAINILTTALKQNTCSDSDSQLLKAGLELRSGCCCSSQ